ncbi:hypothetical protein ACIGNX_01550 [Actinosynnema sp. NPDC053489]|uniref:hypothetical protein n=1 Tax=Actinosynnema sp. NPDC053489 TaxID=3363916 RepID=UPI0037C6F8D4
MAPGKYQVDEDTLITFANDEIPKFLNATNTDPVILKLIDYESGGNRGPEHELLPGNAKNFPVVTELRKEFTGLLTRLHTRVGEFRSTMSRTRIDLLQINTVTQNGEDDANLTAEELMTALQDVFRPSSTTTPTTSK